MRHLLLLLVLFPSAGNAREKPDTFFYEEHPLTIRPDVRLPLRRPDMTSFEELRKEIWEKRAQQRIWKPRPEHKPGSPVFVNGSTITLRILSRKKIDPEPNQLLTYEVAKNAKEVCRFQTYAGIVDREIKGFFSHGNDWVVEYRSHVILNGKPLNKELGHEEVFHYQFLRENPIFFSGNDKKYRLHIDGKPISGTFDQIVHHDCCEPGVHNVRIFETMVTFKGRRGEQWYYVEAGIEP